MPQWGLYGLRILSVSGSVYGLNLWLREEYVPHDDDLKSLVSGLGMGFPKFCVSGKG